MLGNRLTRLDQLVTGRDDHELFEPGQPIAEHQVRRSNAYAVAAELRGQGFERITDDHIADDERRLHERLALHLAERDVLIVSGGISKGRFDLVPKVLKLLGVEEVFHQVAQRPGMPMWFGAGPRGQLVFGLPGNPVSTLICLVRYVVPALAAAMGAPPELPQPIALAAPIKLHRMVSYFVPVTVESDAAGRPQAVPHPPNGPGDFLALAGTHGFIELPPRAEPFPAGFMASLYRWARR
jgi:molybdopterin molybdotransferase